MTRRGVLKKIRASPPVAERRRLAVHGHPHAVAQQELDRELAERLRGQGFTVKVFRDKMHVDLVPTPRANGTDVVRYEVPLFISQAKFRINIEESFDRAVGVVLIAAGDKGQQMFPFYVPNSSEDASRVQAKFSLPLVVSSVRLVQNGHLVIRRHRLFKSGDKEGTREVLIYSSVLIDGKGGTIVPPELAGFQPAIEAALDKLACQDCREPHYALERNGLMGKPVATS